VAETTSVSRRGCPRSLFGVSGIDSIEEIARFYPQGRLAAPLLGFTDIDAKGLEALKKRTINICKESQEKFEERDATGQHSSCKKASLRLKR